MNAKIKKLIEKEEERQKNTLNLIASENYVSSAIQSCLASVLTNKYAEGYPGERYYGGCEIVDQVEALAKERACELFGAEDANVQPHSGSQANQAAFLAFLKPGDPVLALSLSSGGHITHGLPVNFSGIFYDFHHYELDENQKIDPNQVRELALKVRPRLIIVGATCYSRVIHFEPFRAIADEVNAIFMVDMAHISGLVAGGVHPSPVPWADVVTSTTHKTLRGPRGGLILQKKKWSSRINRALMPGIQGGPLLHVIAGKAQCFWEAQQPSFARYAQQVVQNCRRMSEALTQRGWQVVGGVSENHLLSLDLRSQSFSGKEAEQMLDEAGISVNKNLVPQDPRSPKETSGIRLGSAALTTQGFFEADFEWVVDLIDEVLRKKIKAGASRKKISAYLKSKNILEQEWEVER